MIEDLKKMKILFINKFLHLNGGSETYIYNLGKYLISQGNKVEYFGMEHEDRCMGNNINSYVKNIDFRAKVDASKAIYALKTIYSREARRKIRKVLDDFKPDICHLNNFNYQLTPSIILEIRKWQRKTGIKCKIIFTAHDYQLLCPNHMFYNLSEHKNCEMCISGKYYHCLRNRCIHSSVEKSLIGALEGYFWRMAGVYKEIDTIICCSEFMKRKMDQNPLFSQKTVVMHNFVDIKKKVQNEKKRYVLYFGRFSEEKGVRTLAQVCKLLPKIPFVFAGTGPLETVIENIPNIRNVGFQTGEKLIKLISEALFSVCPSECYENCPFSVMESQLYGTPVLGADIGGIPELICVGESGELFEGGNKKELYQKISEWWNNPQKMIKYSERCQKKRFDTVSEYCEKLVYIMVR